MTTTTTRAAQVVQRQVTTSTSVKAYLESLSWDGTRRLCASTFPRSVFRSGVPGCTVVKIMTAWFVSAVARAFVPGCACDQSLVLFGASGGRKSRLLRVLGGDAYAACTPFPVRDANIAFTQSWIVELCDVTRRDALETAKVLLASRQDVVRPWRARRAATIPRASVVVLTANECVADTRRLLPVEVRSPIDVAFFQENRDQLWAEAVARYKKGVPWWVDVSE